MRRHRRALAVVVGLAAVAVAGFAGWWIFVRNEAPPRADIETASETLQDDDAGVGGGRNTGTPPAGEGLDGTWTVDTSVGSFDDFSSTWAGYRIDQELAGVGRDTAAGRTPDVDGSLTIDGDEVTEAAFEVDLTTIDSGEPARDQTMRSSGLETDSFPTATFRLTGPITLPDGVESDERVTATAAGELTVHGTTRVVNAEIEAQLTDQRAVVVGRAPVALADFGIDPPSGIGPVVSVADEGELEFQIFLTRAG
jgi:polyisoprenoid-binding protein YceI